MVTRTEGKTVTEPTETDAQEKSEGPVAAPTAPAQRSRQAHGQGRADLRGKERDGEVRRQGRGARRLDGHRASNRITALIGPSGCGKSTLIRCFNRMCD